MANKVMQRFSPFSVLKERQIKGPMWWPWCYEHVGLSHNFEAGLVNMVSSWGARAIWDPISNLPPQKKKEMPIETLTF